MGWRQIFCVITWLEAEMDNWKKERGEGEMEKGM